MALSKALKLEISRAERDPSYQLFSGDVLLPEDYLLYQQLNSDTSRYQELEQDCQIYSKLQTRKLAVTGREWLIKPGGKRKNGEIVPGAIDKKAADLATEVVESLEFDRICTELMDAILTGYKVAEILWEPVDGRILPTDIRVRDETRFTFVREGAKYDLPKTPPGQKPIPVPTEYQTIGGYELRFLASYASINGERVPINKFVTYSFGSKTGNPLGVGLGNKLWWMVEFKREITKNWLIFIDRFSQPIPYGEFESGGDRDELDKFLASISNGSWASLPSGYKLSFLEAQRTGTIDTYKGFEDWCDSNIARVIVGESYGSSASQGLSGQPAANDEKIRQEIVKADSDLLSAALNRYLFTPLTILNFPKAKPPGFWRKFEEEEDLDSRAGRDKTLYDMGFRLKLEAVTEIYGDYYEDTQATEEGDGLEALLGGSGAATAPTTGDEAATEEPAIAGDGTEEDGQNLDDAAGDGGDDPEADVPDFSELLFELDYAETIDLYSADFAAPKQCKKGISCGGSCIPRSKACVLKVGDSPDGSGGLAPAVKAIGKSSFKATNPAQAALIDAIGKDALASAKGANGKKPVMEWPLPQYNPGGKAKTDKTEAPAEKTPRKKDALDLAIEQSIAKAKASPQAQKILQAIDSARVQASEVKANIQEATQKAASTKAGRGVAAAVRGSILVKDALSRFYRGEITIQQFASNAKGQIVGYFSEKGRQFAFRMGEKAIAFKEVARNKLADQLNQSLNLPGQTNLSEGAGAALEFAEPTSVMVGFWLPLDVAQQIAIPPDRLPEAEEPEKLHLTLGYFGKMASIPNFDALQDRLIEFCQSTPVMPSLIGGWGRFLASESSDGKDVIYASIDTPGLPEFRQKLLAICAEFGLVAKANHGFTPHVTLAYINPGDSFAPEIQPRDLRLERLVLAAGGVHHSYPLQGAVSFTAPLLPESESDFAATGERDAADRLTDKGAAAVSPVIRRNLAQIKEALAQAGNSNLPDSQKFQEAKSRLIQLYPALANDRATYARTLRDASVLANLAGRDEVIRETDGDAAFGKSGVTFAQAQGDSALEPDITPDRLLSTLRILNLGSSSLFPDLPAFEESDLKQVYQTLRSARSLDELATVYPATVSTLRKVI